mmetsp:Transcript_813/g.2478  ORF Transcript_813/g.2478 Transcript_813/m.2478 type:complete len:460 (-) Transcript_813:354-1733(-)
MHIGQSRLAQQPPHRPVGQKRPQRVVHPRAPPQHLEPLRGRGRCDELGGGGPLVEREQLSDRGGCGRQLHQQLPGPARLVDEQALAARVQPPLRIHRADAHLWLHGESGEWGRCPPSRQLGHLDRRSPVLPVPLLRWDTRQVERVAPCPDGALAGERVAVIVANEHLDGPLTSQARLHEREAVNGIRQQQGAVVPNHRQFRLVARPRQAQHGRGAGRSWRHGHVPGPWRIQLPDSPIPCEREMSGGGARHDITRDSLQTQVKLAEPLAVRLAGRVAGRVAVRVGPWPGSVEHRQAAPPHELHRAFRLRRAGQSRVPRPQPLGLLPDPVRPLGPAGAAHAAAAPRGHGRPDQALQLHRQARPAELSGGTARAVQTARGGGECGGQGHAPVRSGGVGPRCRHDGIGKTAGIHGVAVPRPPDLWGLLTWRRRLPPARWNAFQLCKCGGREDSRYLTVSTRLF